MRPTEGAGRPPRIASQPAGSRRSRPPGSTAKEPSVAPRRPRAPLLDSEVSEIERELTDDDLGTPDDPAERARVENATRRLADQAHAAELAAAGFTGLIFDVAVTEWASYGIAVLMAWMRTGQIAGKCAAKGRPMSDFAPRWSRDDRLEIAIEATARGLRYFIDEVLKPGKWDHRRGTTLKTYFIGACLLQFPNVFDIWATDQRRWAQLDITSEEAPDDGAGRGDPQWADPTGAAVLRKCTVGECLAGIQDQRTREAARMVFGYGASHAEAGAAVGLSAAGVEGRLYRLRIGRPE